MKMEWLVADVTPVRSPDRAEHGILEMNVDVFVVNSGCYGGQETTL